MKALFLALLSLAIISSSFAQEFKHGFEKEINDKLLSLQQLNVHIPVLQPRSIVVPPGIYKLPQDGMLCLVPDTKKLVPVPNALPELKIPDVAAIPNPALKTAWIK